MKRFFLLSAKLFVSVSLFSQNGIGELPVPVARQNFNLSSNSFLISPSIDLQPASFYSGQNRRSNSLGGSRAVMDVLASKFGLKLPTRYHYNLMGVDFQAGILTNSRQPKLGAGFSTGGFNFSAGYGVGVNMNNLSRMGASPFSKNQGIQFTAGFRLFGKK